MPRFTAGNGTSECGVAQAQGFRDGRWTVMAVWTLTLAPIEEAGYIDARPHIRQIGKTSCDARRTIHPGHSRPGRASRKPGQVRYAPKAQVAR